MSRTALALVAVVLMVVVFGMFLMSLLPSSEKPAVTITSTTTVTVPSIATLPVPITSETTVREVTTVTKSQVKTVTVRETITVTKTVANTYPSSTITSSFTPTTTTTTSSFTTTTATTTSAIPQYELSEAIANRYVSARIVGRCHPLFGCGGFLGGGVSSGDSIVLELTRLVDHTVKIVVPMGSLLLASGNAQNMVVRGVRGITEDSMFYTPVSQIVLDTPEVTRYLLSAYCVNFNKPNPTNETVFSLGGSANPEILGVLGALYVLPSNVTSVQAVQVAIFVITDDVSKEELDDRFPVEPQDIENAKTILNTAGIDSSTKKLFT